MNSGFGEQKRKVAQNKRVRRIAFVDTFVLLYNAEINKGRCARGAFQVAMFELKRMSKEWEKKEPQFSSLIIDVRMDFMKELENLFYPNRYSDDKLSIAFKHWKEEKTVDAIIEPLAGVR